LLVSIGNTRFYTSWTAETYRGHAASEYAGKSWAELCHFGGNAIKSGSVVINHVIDARSSASFELLDEVADIADFKHFDEGQEVKIMDLDGTRLFGGLLAQAVEKRFSQVREINRHTFDCTDYHALAENRRFFAGYESTTGGAVCRAILEVLSEEGITEGLIQEGIVLTDLVFPFVSCAEALDKIAELCGYIWFISENKQLYFLDRTTYTAAWHIQDGSEILADTVEVTNGNPEYRNVQIIDGGQAETIPKTEYKKGDGTNRTFTVGYPLAREPTITIGGVEQGVGIKGVEVGKQFYWNKGDPTVTQDQNETVLDDGAIVRIDYIGSFKLLVKSSKAAEITSRKAIQGFGSGKVEKIASDSTATTQNAALLAAQAKLDQYAMPGKVLTYETLADGLAAGVLQNVTLERHGIVAQDLLISNVQIKTNHARRRYAVTALIGPVTDDWKNLFCGIAEDARKKQQDATNTSDSVQGLETFSKTWLSSEHPNPFITVLPGIQVSDSDFPCLTTANRLCYVVLYSGGVEYFRKPITTQTVDGHTIRTTAVILSAEANGTPISHVGLWGGDLCDEDAGSGVEMSKFAFVRLKNSKESLQFDFTDIKGW
jgi:hypothetical protein